MTIIISKLDALGYYADETATITWSDRIPVGYVVADPPSPVEGKFAFWMGEGWAYNETGPAGGNMVTLSAIDAAGYYAGQSVTISAAEGCPVGWVRAAPPEPAEGLHAYWAGEGWAQTEVAPGPSLDALKAAKRYEIVEGYEAYITRGAPWEFGGQAETLQMRDTDRTNWMVLQREAEKQIALGNGPEPCALPVRTTSNTQYAVTNDEALAITEHLTGWGLPALASLWAKKDALAASRSAPDVAAIDASPAGWPS